MSMRMLLPFALVLAVIAATVPPAAAQSAGMNATCGKDWHGKENEFGRICMRYQDSMMGKEIPLEAKIKLHRLYSDRDATYFLFMVNAQGTPFKATDVRLTLADGEEIPLYQRDVDGGSVKLLVDVQNMPPAGTEIVLSGLVGSCDRGLYQIGALVQPFNYRWQRVVMDDGQPADLYSFTQIGVNEATCRGGIPGLPKLESPPAGLAGAVAALAGVALLVGRRR